MAIGESALGPSDALLARILPTIAYAIFRTLTGEFPAQVGQAKALRGDTVHFHSCQKKSLLLNSQSQMQAHLAKWDGTRGDTPSGPSARADP
jgi:hypothetical protein